MSLNTFLIQLVGISCAWSLLRAKRVPRGWVAISGAILLILLGLLWGWPDIAGWLSSGLWFGLVLVPLLGIAQVNRFVQQERYRSAQTVMRVIRWLHPWDGFWDYPQILQALVLAQQGDIPVALQLLKQHQDPHTFLGRTAAMWFYRITAQWAEVRFWVERLLPERLVDQDAAIATFYLRSLGELGELNQLVQQFQQLEQTVSQTGNSLSLQTARLLTCAFCGRTDGVSQLLTSTAYSDYYRRFWLATAETAAGQHPSQSPWVDLQRSTGPMFQAELHWRVSHPPAIAAKLLTPQTQQDLNRLVTTLDQEHRYSLQAAMRRSAPATWILIALNLVVFGIETVMGGSDDLYVLYRLGGMVPRLVMAGEGWRLLAATFLHSGPAHLLANMLALYVFGNFVEQAIGRWRFLATYFICGVGSMGLLALYTVLFQAPNQLCVGASGAIMGLLGVMGAILLQGWRREQATIAREQFRMVLLILLLQVMSDLLTPQVSLLAHVLGLIIGFGTGFLLQWRSTSIRRL